MMLVGTNGGVTTIIAIIIFIIILLVARRVHSGSHFWSEEYSVSLVYRGQHEQEFEIISFNVL